MNPFWYSEDFIGEREFMFVLPSAIIGVSMLSLPSELAKVTSYGDGWISILLGGIMFTLIALLALKVAAYFPEKSFLDYTSFLLTKPVAIIISMIFIIIGIFVTSYIVGTVAFISQRYLFDSTPLEVLALVFLLVVVYAVSGSRVGLFRLNILFLPIILFVFIFIGLFNIQWYEATNFFPLFQTDVRDYLKGISKTIEAFSGYGIILFYFFMIYKPKNMTKKVITGMSVPTILYIFIFLMSIGIFGNAVTENLLFPTIEVAKRVEIPGGIFERIDAFVFTIWVMAFFNTLAITLDVTVLLLCSIFQKVKKRMMTFILSPIVFYISMFPQEINLVIKASSVLAQFQMYYTFFIIIILYLIARIRGVTHRDKL